MNKSLREQFDEALATNTEVDVLLSFTTMHQAGEAEGKITLSGTVPERFNRPVLRAKMHPFDLAQIENETGSFRVFANDKLKPHLDKTVGLSQVTRVMQVMPELTGAGTSLAVIDTGCYLTHPDFAGRISLAGTISALGTTDTYGHGTHVASIAAGAGTVYRGMAPGAQIYAVKASGADNLFAISDLLTAVDFIEPLAVDVLNLSLGNPGDYNPAHPLTIALNALVADGTIVVVSTGNEGDVPGAINWIAANPNVIAVAALTEQLCIATYSSRGDGAGKPDIAANGSNVVAARSSSSADAPYNGDSSYTEKSGTSMAAPVVSGICLLMRQQDPDITPEQAKLLLMYTADKVGLSADEAGAGAVNAYFALNPSERTRNLSMVKLSLGLQAAVLGSYGIARMLDNGIIDVYSGDPPPLAHMAATGTHLARITKNGDAFNAGSPVNGLTLNRSNPHELTDDGAWVLTGVADGAAGWWRWKWYLEDPDTSDPYYPRLDGIVGDTLFLTSETITAAEQVPIDRFYLVFG